MNHQIFENLREKADEFGSIAKKVNESSKTRKACSEKAMEYIDKSLKIGEVLKKDLETVANTNIIMRDQDNVVLNTCVILKSNINEQIDMINDLKKSVSINADIIEDCISKINYLSEAIDDALSNIQKIIKMDNEIILIDDKILMCKQLQQDSLKTLKEITKISLQDAKKAIKGSSSNLERGLQMVEKFQNVQQLIEDNNLSELNNLIKEARKGWNIAVDVNKSSSSQYEFAEKVNNFTKQLHRDSISLRDMVVEKHRIFEENLQYITVLTVILSLKFKKYLQIEESLDKMEYNGDIHELINRIMINVKIACKDIKNVSSLNYDMADSSHLNNEIEDKAVKSTEKEIEYYDSTAKEVGVMTEATKYPIEGSGKNIKNGQILEDYLKNLLDQEKH
ncbi:MAG: hypothetical protein SVZ03_07965 [Spirochaetota bacterium]|nr:hypothetical protein [Spirochaetota bacterium]